MVRELAGAGADTRAGLPNGTTPLLLALGVGVVNNADRRGLDILDGGIIEGEDRVLATVEALIALKADLAAVTKAGDSPRTSRRSVATTRRSGCSRRRGRR